MAVQLFEKREALAEAHVTNARFVTTLAIVFYWLRRHDQREKSD